METPKKYQIFISSTFNDLVEERQEIVRACLEMGHIPIGMEMFNAGSADQWKTITRTIDQCDYYAVVVGRRYGSTMQLDNRTVSFTEREFEYAMEKEIPVLGFPIHDEGPRTKDQTDSNQSEVNAFRQRVCSGRTVDFWKNSDDLKAKFIVSLIKETQNSPRTGWIRADAAADPSVANGFARLLEENQQLREELDSKPETDVLGLVGEMAGVRLKPDPKAEGAPDRLINFFLMLGPPMRSGIESEDAARLVANRLDLRFDGTTADPFRECIAEGFNALHALGLADVEGVQINTRRADVWKLSPSGQAVYRELYKRQVLKIKD